MGCGRPRWRSSRRIRLSSRGLDRLGVAGRRNVCVARGLKTMVGFGTRRFAVIDVGTNSVKFHWASAVPTTRRLTLVDRAEITRLGEGQDAAGVLADAAIARTVEAIVTMVDEASRAGATALAAVGTAGLRRAPNRAVLVDAVHDRAGVAVEVISGDEEGDASPTSRRRRRCRWRGRLVVFDSGGGSTQFSFGQTSTSSNGSASTSVRCGSRSGSASRRRSRRPYSTQRWPNSRRSWIGRTADRSSTRRGDRRDGHQPRRGQARRSAPTTPTACTGRSSTRRARPADRAVSHVTASRTGASSSGSSRLAPK